MRDNLLQLAMQSVVVFLCLCILSCRPLMSDESPVDPLNIIFIMADDHAKRAISAYGEALIDTPNIDRLAREGVMFTRAFVANAICGPSRATLLTGTHSHVNGFVDNRNGAQFDGSQVTFPKLLRNAGYETSIFGKWHLGSDPEGFDIWNILLDQGEYYSPQFRSRSGVTRRDGEYVSDAITDQVIEYLENRDAAKPFALLYHHKAPHRNWMPNVEDLRGGLNIGTPPLPDNFRDQYEGRPAAGHQDMRVANMYLGWDMKLQPGQYEQETGTGGYRHELTFDPTIAEKRWQHHYGRMTADQRARWDEYYSGLATAYQQNKDNPVRLAEWMYQRYMHDYLGTIRGIDKNVGRVLDYLDESGLAANTIVIYTSDQGFFLGEHGWFDKRFMYEESMSIPLLVRLPSHYEVRPEIAQLVQNIDFAPTLLDFANVDVPDEIQGRSLKPIIFGEDKVKWRTGLYYQYYEYPIPHAVLPHYGIRTQDHKLIRFEGATPYWEFYDLINDPQEMTNLFSDPSYQSIVDDLMSELAELRDEYGVLSEKAHAVE